MSHSCRLPVDIDDFRTLRKDHSLYVDKTLELLRLIQGGKKYFFARPYGFGKTLRASTSFPILLIELKWDRTARTASQQIHERQYPAALAERPAKLLLVGISYDKETTQHTCCIERFQL